MRAECRSDSLPIPLSGSDCRVRGKQFDNPLGCSGEGGVGLEWEQGNIQEGIMISLLYRA